MMGHEAEIAAGISPSVRSITGTSEEEAAQARIEADLKGAGWMHHRHPNDKPCYIRWTPEVGRERIMIVDGDIILQRRTRNEQGLSWEEVLRVGVRSANVGSDGSVFS